MRVLKFGGTSVGTVESLKNVRQIISSLSDSDVVVVSALGGLTDMLIKTAQEASTGKSDFRKATETMRKRHQEIIDALVIENKKKAVEQEIEKLFLELNNIYTGVSLLEELTDRTLDRIVSFGERMSSIIVANIISHTRHVDSLDFIRTERRFNKNIASTELTTSLLKKIYEGGNGIIVMGGFISRDKDTGMITNLGRGGSDYTAALVAATLNADVLEIWTDVDGFMTADPKIVSEAFVVHNMSFVESMELCSYGAKVIYPPTIYPVFHKNIPIRILNTFNIAASGTIITEETQTDLRAKGVSAIRDTSLISITGDLAEDAVEINRRVYTALAKQGINVILVSPMRNEEKLSFAVTGADSKVALEIMNDEFAPEMSSGEIETIQCKDNLATIAVVGENIKADSEFNKRIYDSLTMSCIPVYAWASAGSTTTVTLVVANENVPCALRAIHTTIFGDLIR